jgi:prepilin-type N-terminal cleavage/methylation domain-containing protein
MAGIRGRGENGWSSRPKQRGLTFIEILVAIFIVSVALIPSIAMVQQTRIHARTVGYNLVGMNLAVAMTELVKRSGYNEVEYGWALPGILDSADAPNPLLDFPRSNADGSNTEINVLQAGIAGGATPEELEEFLENAREGTPDRESPVIVNDENYLFFSPEQIGAMNGIDDLSLLSEEELAELLNPAYAWGIAIEDGDPADEIGQGYAGTGLKKVVVIVKWRDVRRGFRDFAVLETIIAEKANRM